MDKDKNGFLDYIEIKQAFENYSDISKMDSNDLHQILSHLDYNKDSKISINDFIAASMDI